MDAHDVLELLRRQVKEAGSISEYSRQSGVHPATLSNFLGGCYKKPGPTVLCALGLKAVVTYEPIEKK